MFHGVPVNIINMTGIILFITDTMFPETALPDAALTTFGTARGTAVTALRYGKSPP